jgi:hypothetical protein
MDEIALTLPRRRPFYSVAHLVVGGLAVRLDLTLEHLEDLQLAIESLLDRPDERGEVNVTLRVEGDEIRARIGPFAAGPLRAELEREAGSEVGLRRLLDTLVDAVELDERDGSDWVELTKAVERSSA